MLSRGKVRPEIMIFPNAPLNQNTIIMHVVDYDAFSEALRAIDKRPDVLATIWQGEQCPASPVNAATPASAVLMLFTYVSKREVVLRVSIRHAERRHGVSNLMTAEPPAPLCSGTSVKRTVNFSEGTVRDVFNEAIAPVNTDVSRAVSPGTFGPSSGSRSALT